MCPRDSSITCPKALFGHVILGTNPCGQKVALGLVPPRRGRDFARRRGSLVCPSPLTCYPRDSRSLARSGVRLGPAAPEVRPAGAGLLRFRVTLALRLRHFSEPASRLGSFSPWNLWWPLHFCPVSGEWDRCLNVNAGAAHRSPFLLPTPCPRGVLGSPRSFLTFVMAWLVLRALM